MSDRTEAADRRIVVVAGHPTDDELTAIAVALDAHGHDAAAPPPPVSRWSRAARLEGRGHPPIAERTELPRP